MPLAAAPPSSSTLNTNDFRQSPFLHSIVFKDSSLDCLDSVHYSRYESQLIRHQHHHYPSSQSTSHSSSASTSSPESLESPDSHCQPTTHFSPTSDAPTAPRAETGASSNISIPSRRLTLTTSTGGDEDMATTTFAPSSPPDLSSSKSSTKSSSLQSSPFANDEVNDASHFEDISLAADSPPSQPPAKSSIKPRPLVRAPQSPTSPQSTLPSPNTAQDLRTSIARNNHVRSLQSPTSPRRNWQRANSSPLIAPPPFGRALRTPSPNKSSPLLLSPRSPNRIPLHLRSREHSPISPKRRMSWQNVKRKTAEELEQEYHDSDEELPEDAIVWNIPLTPRPVESRSQSASPDRSIPRQRPGIKKLKPPRSKSWTDAMGELSDDVKALTEALELHADASGDTERSQSTELPTRPSLKNFHSKSMNLPVQRGHALIDPLPASKEKEKYLTRTRPSWLPPKSPKEERKHLKEWERMMSDFLASEKRKTVSQTKIRASSERQIFSAAQEWQNKILPNWEASVRTANTREMWWRGIPNSVRGLVWTKAIGNELQLSYASYSAALKRASGGEAGFDDHNKENVSRSTEHSRPLEGSPKQDTRMGRSLRALDADIAITFPALSLFQPGNPLYKSLRDILKAYAAYRSDTGYIRGTSGIAALLLLHLSSKLTTEPIQTSTQPTDAPRPNALPTTSQEEAGADTAAISANAFILLSNLLNKQPILGFCLSDPGAKRAFAFQVHTVLEAKLPRLAQHFARLGLGPDDWLTPMLLSLFTTLLSPVEASRIWDVLVFEGNAAFVRAVVGVLTRVESRLYGGVEEIVGVLGWKGWVARRGEAIAAGGGVEAEKSQDDAAEALMACVRSAGRRDVVEFGGPETPGTL